MAYKLEISLQYPGERPMRRALVVYERIDDLSPAWRRVVPLLQEYTDKYIQAEGAYEGNPKHPALSPRYAAWKSRYYPGRPILVLTGRLRQSLVSTTADSIVSIHPDRMVYGTQVPYAIYHQLGTHKMPRRPPLRLSRPLVTRIVSTIREYLFRQGEARAMTTRV